MYNSLFYYLLKTNTQHSQSCDERVRAEWFTRHGGGILRVRSFLAWLVISGVAFHFLRYKLERPVYL